MCHALLAAGSLLLDLRLGLGLGLGLGLLLYSLAAVLRRTTAHVVADLVVVEPQALAQAARVHQVPLYVL